MPAGFFRKHTPIALLSFTSETISRLLEYISARVWLSMMLIGVVAFCASAFVGLVRGVPVPVEHDEFSYLLAADTFAHGRLTNPPHPMWIHFESFHILQQPSYQSKYPPGQGLMLAAGQALTGYPIVGVWLSFALMCSGICWMLYAWAPSRWALLGALLAILHPQLGFTGYWAQSYWGGAISAFGGAIALGSLRRLIRNQLVSASLLLVFGCGVLANTRPFEGLLLTILAGVVLMARLISKKGPPFLITLKRVCLPGFALSALIVAGMAYYNFRVTNHPLRLPYQTYENTYAAVPLFLWQKPRPQPTYRHKDIFKYQVTQTMPVYEFQRSFRGFGLKMLFFLALLIKDLLNVYAIPFIGIFRILSIHVWRNRWARFAMVTSCFVSCGVLSGTYFLAHYFSPILSLIYFFIVTAMRLCVWQDKKSGTFFIWFIPVLALSLIAGSLYTSFQQERSSVDGLERANLVRKLNQENGKHLLIVTYGPAHIVSDEWIYNEADIDNSKVVWARKMDRTEDCRLIEYFSQRRVWSVELDGYPLKAKITPYPRDHCQTNPL